MFHVKHKFEKLLSVPRSDKFSLQTQTPAGPDLTWTEKSSGRTANST